MMRCLARLLMVMMSLEVSGKVFDDHDNMSGKIVDDHGKARRCLARFAKH